MKLIKKHDNYSNIDKDEVGYMPKGKDKIEKKIKKRRRVIKILILIIFISSLVILMLKSEYFNIQNVVVRNNNFVTSDEVTVLSESKGKNIFLVSKDKLEENIQKNPYIESIEIKRKLPSTLIIDVNEKKIKGLIKFQNSYVNVDSKGRMVQIINKFPNGKIPLIEGIKVEQFVPGGNLINGNEIFQSALEDILAIGDYNEYKGRILSINVGDFYNIVFKTTDGFDIKIGDWTDINNKLTYAYNVLISPEVKGKKGTIEILQLQSEYRAVFREN